MLYSSSAMFIETFSRSWIILNIKLSEQMVTAGNGTSPIGISLSAIRMTVRLAKYFSVVWKINKKKMVAEMTNEQVQKTLEILLYF